jgi:hypothetical protein
MVMAAGIFALEPLKSRFMMQGDGLGFEAMGVKEDEGEPTFLDEIHFKL